MKTLIAVSVTILLMFTVNFVPAAQEITSTEMGTEITAQTGSGQGTTGGLRGSQGGGLGGTQRGTQGDNQLGTQRGQQRDIGGDINDWDNEVGSFEDGLFENDLTGRDGLDGGVYDDRIDGTDSFDGGAFEDDGFFREETDIYNGSIFEDDEFNDAFREDSFDTFDRDGFDGDTFRGRRDFEQGSFDEFDRFPERPDGTFEDDRIFQQDELDVDTFRDRNRLDEFNGDVFQQRQDGMFDEGGIPKGGEGSIDGTFDRDADSFDEGTGNINFESIVYAQNVDMRTMEGTPAYPSDLNGVTDSNVGGYNNADTQRRYDQVPLDGSSEFPVNGQATTTNLSAELDRLDRMGRQEMQQWQSDELNRLRLAQSANDLAVSELNFAYEQAIAEGADQTAGAIQTIISNRQKRYNETIGLIQQLERRQQLRDQQYEMDGYRSPEQMQLRREELQRREYRRRPQDTTNTYRGTEY